MNQKQTTETNSKHTILKVNEYELKTNNRNHKKTYIYEKDIHI